MDIAARSHQAAPDFVAAHKGHLPDNYGHPDYVVQYRGDMMLTTELILLGVTLLVVALRLFTRVHILGSVHSDDWWILLGTATLIALTTVHCVGVKYGIGKHEYDLENSDTALTMGYIGQILYVATLGCVKLSLLLFLQRIFPTKPMKRALRAVLVFVLCFTVTCIFLFAFQCDTPEYYFAKVKGAAAASTGVCLSPQLVYYPMSGLNILTDLVIWLMPVPLVLRAGLTRKEKLGLLWVFVLGGIAVGAGIVRPFALRDIMDDGDPTWSMVNVSVWAMVEVSVGVICASLPAIKPLIIRVAPRLLVTHSAASRADSRAHPAQHEMTSIKITHEIHQREGPLGVATEMGYQRPEVRRCEEEAAKMYGNESEEELCRVTREMRRVSTVERKVEEEEGRPESVHMAPRPRFA